MWRLGDGGNRRTSLVDDCFLGLSPSFKLLRLENHPPGLDGSFFALSGGALTGGIGSGVLIVGGNGGIGGGGSEGDRLSLSDSEGDEAEGRGERSDPDRLFSVPLALLDALGRGSDAEGARRIVLKNLDPKPGDDGNAL